MSLVDLHCHILPGIDDGPDTMEASLDLARVAVRNGVGRVVATPHVNIRHGNDASAITAATELLREAVASAGIPLAVETGAEIAGDRALELEDGELRRLALGGGSWLLVEPSAKAGSFAIHETIHAIRERGFDVLIAHPERIPAFQADPDLIADLVRTGSRTQLTAESLTGRYGSDARKLARHLLDSGLAHVVASDAHHAELRPPVLDQPIRRAGFGYLAEWLCVEMPAWILEGGPEPARPAAEPKRRFLGRFRSERI